MSSGERPIGTAKGKQSKTEALCQPPPPPPGVQQTACPPNTWCSHRIIRGLYCSLDGWGGGVLRANNGLSKHHWCCFHNFWSFTIVWTKHGEVHSPREESGCLLAVQAGDQCQL